MSASTGTRGFALLGTLVALVVALALMAAGSLFILSETRAAENQGHEAQAAGAAEYGVAATLETWSDGWDSLTGVTIPRRPTPGRTGWYSGTVHRLQDGLFLIDISGTSGGARTRMGLLVELAPALFPDTSHQSGGEVTGCDGVDSLGGVLLVSGSSTDPPNQIDSVTTSMRTNGDSSMSIRYANACPDSDLQAFGRPRILRSRSWIRLF